MKPSTLDDYKQRMLRVLVHIQSHLDDDLALAHLARVACFSLFHFHRIFSGMMGESLKDHVRRLRLERAAIQLKLSRQSVTQIALAAGYEAHEAFTRAFKGAYGISPMHFRSQKSPMVKVPARSGVHYRKNKPLRNFKANRPRIKNINVKIERVEPLRVAFLRHTGPYREVSATWDKLLPALGKEGLLGGDSQFIGVCHDDPEVTPPEKIRYDACVTIDAPFTLMGDIGLQTIAGGEYAITTHFGSYEKLGSTYAKVLGQWLPRSGRELRSAPCFEIYLNDPESTEPEELLTDIYVPLEPTRARFTGVKA
jgi:AraC family transcriptional regulator